MFEIVLTERCLDIYFRAVYVIGGNDTGASGRRNVRRGAELTRLLTRVPSAMPVGIGPGQSPGWALVRCKAARM